MDHDEELLKINIFEITTFMCKVREDTSGKISKTGEKQIISTTARTPWSQKFPSHAQCQWLLY